MTHVDYKLVPPLVARVLHAPKLPQCLHLGTRPRLAPHGHVCKRYIHPRRVDMRTPQLLPFPNRLFFAGSQHRDVTLERVGERHQPRALPECPPRVRLGIHARRTSPPPQPFIHFVFPPHIPLKRPPLWVIGPRPPVRHGGPDIVVQRRRTERETRDERAFRHWSLLVREKLAVVGEERRVLARVHRLAVRRHKRFATGREHKGRG